MPCFVVPNAFLGSIVYPSMRFAILLPGAANGGEDAVVGFRLWVDRKNTGKRQRTARIPRRFAWDHGPCGGTRTGGSMINAMRCGYRVVRFTTLNARAGSALLRIS
jgi:hypothetical protein